MRLERYLRHHTHDYDYHGLR